MLLDCIKLYGITVAAANRAEIVERLKECIEAERESITLLPVNFYQLFFTAVLRRNKSLLRRNVICYPTSRFAAFAVQFLSRKKCAKVHDSALMVDLLQYCEKKNKSPFIMGLNEPDLRELVSSFRRITPDLKIKGLMSAGNVNRDFAKTMVLLSKTHPHLLLLGRDVKILPWVLYGIKQAKSAMPFVVLQGTDMLRIYAGVKWHAPSILKKGIFEDLVYYLIRPWFFYRMPLYFIFFIALIIVKLFDLHERSGI